LPTLSFFSECGKESTIAEEIKKYSKRNDDGWEFCAVVAFI